MEQEFERIIEWTPAYDKRHADPAKDGGIHGMNVRFIVRKDNRAVQFLLFTGWHLPHVQQELISNGQVHDGYCSCTAMGADVGYHSPEPMYEGQRQLTEDCEYTGGACYYDGSGLIANEVFEGFVTHGINWLWQDLEARWHDMFDSKQ